MLGGATMATEPGQEMTEEEELATFCPVRPFEVLYHCRRAGGYIWFDPVFNRLCNHWYSCSLNLLEPQYSVYN